jgi:putative phage-type endonuclease
MTATAEPIAGPMPHTAEWYDVHRTHITATDIAPILGRSQYKTALDVFMLKTGQLAPFEGNEHTRRGQRYEPVILADYAEASECNLVYGLPLFFHPTLQFLAATPDAARQGESFPGVLTDYTGQQLENSSGVEAKFSMSPSIGAQLGEEGSDFVPDDWLLQCQTQMAVMGWNHNDVAALLYGRLKIYSIERNDTIIKVIESAAKEMHERIQNNDPPEPQWEHAHTPTLIKELYGVKEDTEVMLSAESESYWTQYQDIGKEVKALNAKREAAKARVLAAMKEAAFGYMPDGRLLVRSTVNRKGYTCEPTSFIQLREKKGK